MQLAIHIQDLYTALEEKAYEEQSVLIAAAYGDPASQAANYGWGVDGDELGTSIATKVYLPECEDGPAILQSYLDLHTGKIDHEWQ